MILIIISIFTLSDFHNEYLFIIQLIWIFVIWPLIVFKINTNGLLTSEKLNNRISYILGDEYCPH